MPRSWVRPACAAWLVAFGLHSHANWPPHLGAFRQEGEERYFAGVLPPPEFRITSRTPLAASVATTTATSPQ